MSNWADISLESMRASRSLREAGFSRSCLSRAYYSVYSEVSRALLTVGVQMPIGRFGPAHKKLIPLVYAHLLGHFSSPELARLCFLVGELYRLRIIADYVPPIDVTDLDARVILGYLIEAKKFLEKVR